MSEPSSGDVPAPVGRRRRGAPKDALVIERSGKTVVSRVTIAATLAQRLRGLMFLPPLAEGEGMMLERCSSVHTAFVRGPIDVVFLTERLRVLRIDRGVRPFRARWPVRGAKKVLELPEGTCEATGLKEGDRLKQARGRGS